jgi:hypothetical protein
MADIGTLNPQQMYLVWQDYLSRSQSSSQGGDFIESAKDKCVILDEALAVATNSKTGATSGLATLCDWSVADEEFVESDPVRQITVYNHSESTAHAIDTFGVARWIQGHWWFFGDCSAMAAR